ncbi:MFS transporter, sugar porter family [Prevotella dentalis DSM 3688]|uniref:MFS family major facilitator transporter n=1 Tax=Prevotella dentalis (strain ATCC 49559 / DSM 3688 / JCM 13448 / NCTC 12043 / ES 2772) TaxID=908937 RepID=F9D5E1_PREDD|nr:sugar porter family MFS transporter [Prevotella dentalis]AGB29174.1 MFS transporter, sugar porter family [Prevotella dentalis DSM 3688]EGQ13251.1 MFS family major facilitator transporter [Prevotella dentalis DSM 3688]
MTATLNKRFVYFICTVSAMGGLLFGYDWVVIGGAKPFYELYFGIADNASMQGLAMTVALVGCMGGAMLCGTLADRIGRKRLLVAASVIFLLSSLAVGAARSFGFFLVARLVSGVGIGLASGLSPMYIAEVAPSAIRGKLVSLNQLTIVLGILAAQLTNWLIADAIPAGSTATQIAASWNGLTAWRWMFWAAIVPSGVFFVLAFLIPESPRWLTMKGRERQALGILTRIGGGVYAEAELRAVREANAADASQGGLRLLLSRPYRRVLVIGLVVAFFQQWCGTNVIFNYAQEIFLAAGYEIGDVLFNIVVTGIANVAFTIVAIFTVDRWGRKALMMLGAGGLCGIYLTLGTCYYLQASGFFMIVLVVAAIACYAMTLGPCTWVLLSEIFPNRVRAVAVATSTFALWVGSSTLTYTFPLLNRALGSYGTFWIYSAVCLAGFIFMARMLPETKGRSLEQLEHELVD